jgi:hypothetical protein
VPDHTVDPYFQVEWYKCKLSLVMVKDKSEAIRQQLLNHESRLIQARLTRDIGFCCEVVFVLFTPSGRRLSAWGELRMRRGSVPESGVFGGESAIGDTSFAWCARFAGLNGC